MALHGTPQHFMVNALCLSHRGACRPFLETFGDGMFVPSGPVLGFGREAVRKVCLFYLVRQGSTSNSRACCVSLGTELHRHASLGAYHPYAAR